MKAVKTKPDNFFLFIFKCEKGHDVKSSTFTANSSERLTALDTTQFTLHCEECGWEGVKLGREHTEMKKV
jgi:hypothetical protein